MNPPQDIIYVPVSLSRRRDNTYCLLKHHIIDAIERQFDVDLTADCPTTFVIQHLCDEETELDLAMVSPLKRLRVPLERALALVRASYLARPTLLIKIKE